MAHPCVPGAVGALYGPLHGGANEAVLRMLERIGKVENIPKFIEGVKNRKEKMFGFGHRCLDLCFSNAAEASLNCCMQARSQLLAHQLAVSILSTW